MRQRLRSHLTFANVVSVIALFVALGGTAAAAFVVSSNSQIGPGTVSGHKPPAGKHANLIAGSINGQDVQDLSFQTLTLKNGWVGNCASGGSPAIAKSVEGVVHLRGEICRTSGTSLNPFAVPAGFIPSKPERVTVNMCVGRTGRLAIGTNGEVTVNSDLDEPNAGACFTSLVGASYTLPF
jgi:hypothetical protein